MSRNPSPQRVHDLAAHLRRKFADEPAPPEPPSDPDLRLAFEDILHRRFDLWHELAQAKPMPFPPPSGRPTWRFQMAFAHQLILASFRAGDETALEDYREWKDRMAWLVQNDLLDQDPMSGY